MPTFTHVRYGHIILDAATGERTQCASINAAKHLSRIHSAPGVRDRWVVRVATGLDAMALFAANLKPLMPSALMDAMGRRFPTALPNIIASALHVCGKFDDGDRDEIETNGFEFSWDYGETQWREQLASVRIEDNAGALIEHAPPTAVADRAQYLANVRGHYVYYKPTPDASYVGVGPGNRLPSILQPQAE